MAVMGGHLPSTMCEKAGLQSGQDEGLLPFAAEVTYLLLGCSGALSHPQGSPAALSLASQMVSGQCCAHERGFKSQLRH